MNISLSLFGAPLFDFNIGPSPEPYSEPEEDDTYVSNTAGTFEIDDEVDDYLEAAQTPSAVRRIGF